MENVVNKTFAEEQDELLYTLLEERFFKMWKKPFEIETEEFGSNIKKDHQYLSNLEIFLTSTCNQKCSYCYLVKHPELYPKEINNKDTILKNLQIIFNWLIENDYGIDELEFFSGEIWHTEFGLSVLELTYRAIQNGLRTNLIVIPSNCSFLLNKEAAYKIQNYINRFSKDLSVKLVFSISVDGKYIENQFRPLNSGEEKTDKFYDDLFLFAQFNNFLFHPMVSAENVKYWIENYKWWGQELKAFNKKPLEEQLMMLEVRNDDWDEESIDNYIKFLEYLIIDEIANTATLKDFFNNLFFNKSGAYGGYIPFCLPLDTYNAGCGIGVSLHIRAGDLAICPCHRTAYNRLLYGHFKVEEDRIIGITANNPELAAYILLGNVQLVLPKCDTCPIKEICLKGCYGAQYESTGDPFMPIPSVCDFMMKKYTYLLNTYKKLGAIEFLETISPYDYNYITAQKYLNLFRKLV